MSKKIRSPGDQARRDKIRTLLLESNMTSVEDSQNLFKDTIAEFMRNSLEAEPNLFWMYGTVEKEAFA